MRTPAADGVPTHPLRVSLGGRGVFHRRAAEILADAGVDARLPPSPNGRGRLKWVRVVRAWVGSDVVLFVFGRPALGEVQKLLAHLGKPFVIQWVGTDVMTRAEASERSMKELAWHWSDAPWLADELRAAGFPKVAVVPLTRTPLPTSMPPFPSDFRVLAYTSESRPAFYGVPFIAELARRLTDVDFVLVGTSHADGLPTNVRCMGWVENMPEVLREVCVFIRPTEHDGLSHTVLEALGHGRHVFWTYSIPGVRAITTIDAVERSLRSLKAEHDRGVLPLNTIGRAMVERDFDPMTIARTARIRLEEIAAARWRRRPGPAARTGANVALALIHGLLLVRRPKWSSNALPGGATLPHAPGEGMRGIHE